MLYMRAPNMDEAAEMKAGIHFMDYVDHHGDYSAHLQWFMTHLVYFSFLPSFNSTFLWC